MGRSAKQWDQLVRGGSDSDRRAGAENRRCPPEVLARFAADDDPEVRRAALRNPRCPAAALAAAAAAGDTRDRWTAMRNPSMPAKQLADAAGDPDPLMRQAAAHNPNCPPELIARLAADPVTVVQCAAAAHPNCPTERIVRFAASRDRELVAAAARNPSCPAPLLVWLTDRHSPQPGTAALFARSVVSAVAGNENTPADALRAIAGRDDGSCLAELALNPATPSDVLALWGRSSSLPAAAEVASRGDCPAETLAAIADPGRDYPTAAAVSAAAHPDCPAETLAAILRAGSETSFAVQLAAFSNPSCPPRLQRRHARDPFFCSRWDSGNKRRRSRADPSGHAPDRHKWKTYRGEGGWPPPPAEPPIASTEDADAVIVAVLKDPDLRSRYPHVADWDYTGVAVDLDVQNAGHAGEYSLTSGRISVRSGSGPKVVLHELAHKIVDSDRRYQQPPLPSAHGPEFTAALLDLVEVRYGAEHRARLRSSYEACGAPLDRWDAPLASIDQPPAEQLLDPRRAAPKQTRRAAATFRCGHPIGKHRRRRCRHRVTAGSRQCAAGHPVRRRGRG